MNRIERRLRAAVNPVSTAVTGWWCHSAWRHRLTGHGPAARERRLLRRDMIRGTGSTPSAEQMKARREAIDELALELRPRRAGGATPRATPPES
jgi:hypothetical protein